MLPSSKLIENCRYVWTLFTIHAAVMAPYQRPPRRLVLQCFAGTDPQERSNSSRIPRPDTREVRSTAIGAQNPGPRPHDDPQNTRRAQEVPNQNVQSSARTLIFALLRGVVSKLAWHSAMHVHTLPALRATSGILAQPVLGLVALQHHPSGLHR